MRKSYLRKLLGYMKKVYKIENTLVIREVLKRIDLSGLENLTSSIVKKLREIRC